MSAKYLGRWLKNKFSDIAIAGVFLTVACVLLGVTIYNLPLVDVLTGGNDDQRASCEVALAFGETETLAPITIIVETNEEAREWLKTQAEGIRGSIWFDGDGDPAHDCKTAPMRAIVLGRTSFEFPDSGKMVLDKIAISKRLKAQLNKPNYYYTVNVVSARKTFPENGLSCSVPMGRIDDLMNDGRAIRVFCTKLGD